MRRRRPEKTTILPDPTFNDIVVAQFINYLMKECKKSKDEKIFYGSLDNIANQLKTDNPIDIFKKALANVNTNFIFHEDLSKILMKVLNKKGILNVGGPTQSVYKFAKKHNPKIKKILSNKVDGQFYPKNPSMSLLKLNKII